MFFKDLAKMLEGLKSNLYYKTFRKTTSWDENYLIFLQSTIQVCIGKSNEILEDLKECNNSKAAFDAYVDVRDNLLNALNDIDGLALFLNLTCDGKLLAFHRLLNCF